MAGVTAKGAGEMLTALHGQIELPSHNQWTELLQRTGLGDATEMPWTACNSSRAELHAYPCALWLLFHTLLAHSAEPEAMPSLHAIVGYITNFFGCTDCQPRKLARAPQFRRH